MMSDGRHKNTVVNPETRTSEETIEDNKGKLLSKTVYDLDDRGLPRVATFFDAKGKQLYKAEYQRDGADRIIGESYSSMAGQSLGRRVYTYSAGGQKARRFGRPPIKEGASGHICKSRHQEFAWILPYPPPVKSLGAKTNHLPNIQGLIAGPTP